MLKNITLLFHCQCNIDFISCMVLTREVKVCLTWVGPGYTNNMARKTQLYFRARPETAIYRIISSTGGIIYQGTAARYLQVSGTGIAIEGIGNIYAPPLIVDTTDQTSIFPQVRRPESASWRTHRGYYEIRVCPAGYLMVINIVPLESYLYGVVPNEMRYTNPTEALKAQAICARTAALGKITRAHVGQPFELCNLIHCQLYGNPGKDEGGYDTEKPETNTAVNETKNIVIKYNNVVAEHIYYFVTCGGRTANNEDVWGGSAVPYLRSIVDDPDRVVDANDVDDFCYHPTVNQYPYYYWTFSISSVTLESRLKADPGTKPSDPNYTLNSNGIGI